MIILGLANTLYNMPPKHIILDYVDDKEILSIVFKNKHFWNYEKIVQVFIKSEKTKDSKTKANSLAASFLVHTNNVPIFNVTIREIAKLIYGKNVIDETLDILRKVDDQLLITYFSEQEAKNPNFFRTIVEDLVICSVFTQSMKCTKLEDNVQNFRNLINKLIFDIVKDDELFAKITQNLTVTDKLLFDEDDIKNVKFDLLHKKA